MLQGQLAQLQADQAQLDSRATAAERDYAAASSELEETKLNLKVKLEEQQNQFRAIEEEQYSNWEKRVIFTHMRGCTSRLVQAFSLVSCCPRSLFCHKAAVVLPPTDEPGSWPTFMGSLYTCIYLKARMPSADASSSLLHAEQSLQAQFSVL